MSTESTRSGPEQDGSHETRDEPSGRTSTSWRSSRSVKEPSAPTARATPAASAA
ncbi:hypothetical protein [Aeromicrobium sp. UC242_57]|uniref:hypothetical protein n=1 Tax=Aeromicrobium sp. UC242_57 TaxID=3374624 RepID=UPI0037B0C9D5